MIYPHVYAAVETEKGVYETETYDVHIERQRPTLAQVVLNEPVGVGQSCILALGCLGNLFRHSAVTVKSCSQEAPETFLVTLLEPVSNFLGTPYIKQFMSVTMETVLRDMAAMTGLTYDCKGDFASEPNNLILISTVRGALDQCWQVFECNKARWAIDLEKGRFIFLPQGKLPVEPLEIPTCYFKEEFDGGIRINIIAELKPYTPVVWRDEERVIDIVRINSKKKSMFLTFVDAA